LARRRGEKGELTAKRKKEKSPCGGGIRAAKYAKGEEKTHHFKGVSQNWGREDLRKVKNCLYIPQWGEAG